MTAAVAASAAVLQACAGCVGAACAQGIMWCGISTSCTLLLCSLACQQQAVARVLLQSNCRAVATATGNTSSSTMEAFV